MVSNNRYHHEWILLLYAAGLFGNAAYAIVKGKIAIFYSSASKADDPLSYWFALVTCVLCGLAGVFYAFL